MNFTVSRDDIYSALQKIIGVVPARTTTPILTNVLLDLKGNNLELTATDLEILTTTRITVTGQEDGSIALPARFLNDILRELKNIPIHFELEDGYRMSIRTDWGEYKLAGDPGEEFPLMPVEEYMNSFEISQGMMQRMIDKCIFAVSKDEMRPALMGVLFQIRPNELRMVGTDGHRLSRMTYKSFQSDVEEADFIVQTKALALLEKNITEPEKSVRVQFGENFIVFDLDDIKIYSRLVESEYPEYEQVIPYSNSKKLLVSTEELLGSIRRVSIFASAISHQVEFDIADNQMEVSSQSLEGIGEGREKLEVDYEGDPILIGFNAQYFIDLLKHIDTPRTKIMLETPITAAMVLPSHQEEDEDLLMLIMPVRLSTEEIEEGGENQIYMENEGEQPSEADEVDF